MLSHSSTNVKCLWNYCNVLSYERWLSLVGEAESAVEVGLVRTGRLRQSVLRSAFEGML